MTKWVYAFGDGAADVRVRRHADGRHDVDVLHVRGSLEVDLP